MVAAGSAEPLCQIQIVGSQDIISIFIVGAVHPSPAVHRIAGTAHPNHPATAKEVLEDGLLGDIQYNGNFSRQDAPAITVVQNKEGEPVVLRTEDTEYIEAVQSIVVNGNWQALSKDKYSIDKEAGTITIEADVFKALAEHLNGGKSARTFDCSDDDKALISTSDLLTLKPIIYAANMDEDGFANQEGNEYLKKVRALAEAEGSEVLPICAKLEQDIAELEGEDRQMFLDELGIAESGLDRLIKCSYSLLGLISFLTYGKDECRAWTIKKGTKAPQAAGKIHTDIERGFIRAEVIAYDDMIKYGGVNAAKEKGQLRSEGKEYVAQDGDMIYFRFNV